MIVCMWKGSSFMLVLFTRFTYLYINNSINLLKPNKIWMTSQRSLLQWHVCSNIICQNNQKSKKHTKYHQILHISCPQQSRTIVVFHPKAGHSKRLHNMEYKVHLPQSSQQTISCTKGTLEYGGTKGVRFRLTIIMMLFFSSLSFSFCDDLLHRAMLQMRNPTYWEIFKSA